MMRPSLSHVTGRNLLWVCLALLLLLTAACGSSQRAAHTYFLPSHELAASSDKGRSLSSPDNHNLTADGSHLAADSSALPRASSNSALAHPLPWTETDSAATWSAHLSMPRGQLSGLCVVLVGKDSIVGAWINEFGLQAFDFTYQRSRQRLRLHHLIPPLRRFFLRRMLKADFRAFAPYFATQRAFVHENRYGIRYEFAPLLPTAPDSLPTAPADTPTAPTAAPMTLPVSPTALVPLSQLLQ